MLLILSAYVIYAQTAAQLDHLLMLSQIQEEIFFEQKEEADRLAALHNLPVRIEYDDGSIAELMRFENGIPIYFVTTNAEGASLLHTDKVYPGGLAGLEISGEGQLLGIWDGGSVYAEHPDLIGRVTQIDTPVSISDHATHVAGTMISGGLDAAARGMSYEACLHAWDWSNDASEMAAAAAGGLLVSQHAYSTITGWRHGSWSGNEGWHWFGDVTISETEDYRFGFYDNRAQLWDEIAYYAPNYIIIKSAGNDRGRGPAVPGTPHYARINNSWTLSTMERELNGGEDGHDCLTRNANSKNIITVGAVNSSGQMTSFSSWGPTDDGRIKPDIVAKGLQVYSTTYDDEDDYGFKSGTSMSSPMISGSIGLMLHHQENLHPGQQLLSSTIKALIIHSANDQISGAPGPDYRYGWGLMNTENAINIITQNATADGIHIRELTLRNGSEINIPVRASGNEPLRATIAWTDVPGTPVDPALNPHDLMLVNDLDMRIIEPHNNYFYPYTLDPNNPVAEATTGDNFRDNLEMVHIASPQAGRIYKINIAHKGTLANETQDFSIIITGNISLSGVGNPLYLLANAGGEDNINLEWNKNENNHDVMLVWSPDNIFGIPNNGTNYDVGLSIPGGGIVLYRGSQESFQHTGLDASKEYAYKIFSYNANNHYSNGLKAYSVTDCGIITQLPFTENFNTSANLPACWDIIDHEGNGQIWQFGTHNNGLSGTTGNYAFVNSDGFGAGNSQNTDLVTPVLDLSAYSEVSLSFTHYFRQYFNYSTAKLLYSIDGGNSWILLEEWAETTENPAFYDESIPELANQSQVLFKWNYSGTWAWWWDIDDIAISGVLTEASEPEVVTAAITNITKTNASGGGIVLNDGGAAVTARGIVWSTDKNPSLESNSGMTQEGESTGIFTSELTGLSQGTTYYVRAYATNSKGTAYGMQTNFKTTEDALIKIFSITVVPDNPAHGTVTGGGIYIQGQQVTVVATASPTYIFNHWSENGDVILDEENIPVGASYTFTVNANRQLVAHFADEFPGIPRELVLDQGTLSEPDPLCFDAVLKIITGNFGYFIVEPGSHVELIAGESIQMLPETHVKSGAYLHARITKDGSFCTEAEEYMASGTMANDHHETTEHQSIDDDIVLNDAPKEHNKLFILYPNPVIDAFTIKLTQPSTRSEALIEIYSTHGRLVRREIISTGKPHIVSMENEQSGVYLVRFILGCQIGVQRLVKR